MTTPSPELIKEAAAILGEDLTKEESEARIRILTDDPMLATRLVEWIPEAFGTAAVSRMGKVIFSNTFQVRDSGGRWITLPCSAEPIFTQAMEMTDEYTRGGREDVFLHIAGRSAVFSSAASALEAGQTLDGAVSSGPAFVSLPAEIYPVPIRPLLSRLLGKIFPSR
ncbi:MAG: hypothetical protein KF712_20035 [Akkermansiaceae bacterium]|nr:hypothetical protein [Akkermansiaceae bacterium]